MGKYYNLHRKETTTINRSEYNITEYIIDDSIKHGKRQSTCS